MSYLESLFSLRGKNALVTGAASGLGRRCAVVLAEAGARVALVDVDEAGLVETAATISQAVALTADVTQSDGVERMLTGAVEALGQIDIVVTCAGVALWKPALEVPEQEFDRVFAVDVKGTWLVAQAVARHMVGRGIRGSIITISSADSHRTQKNLAPYSGAKAAVNHLTRSLAAELAPHGIRVNTLAPGACSPRWCSNSCRSPTAKPPSGPSRSSALQSSRNSTGHSFCSHPTHRAT